MSPRSDGNPIALKYLNYALLQTDIQSGTHSSLNVCIAALYLFHLAPNFIMNKFQAIIRKESVARRNNLFRYLIQTSYVFHLLSRRMQYWPNELMDIYKKKRKRNWSFQAKNSLNLSAALLFCLKICKDLEGNEV